MYTVYSMDWYGYMLEDSLASSHSAKKHMQVHESDHAIRPVPWTWSLIVGHISPCADLHTHRDPRVT